MKIITYEERTINSLLPWPKKGEKENLLEEKERVTAEAKKKRAAITRLIENLSDVEGVAGEEVRKKIRQLNEQISLHKMRESEIERELAALEKNAQVRALKSSLKLKKWKWSYSHHMRNHWYSPEEPLSRLPDIVKKRITQMLLSSEAGEPITLRKDGNLDFKFDLDSAKIRAVIDYL